MSASGIHPMTLNHRHYCVNCDQMLDWLDFLSSNDGLVKFDEYNRHRDGLLNPSIVGEYLNQYYSEYQRLKRMWQDKPIKLSNGKSFKIHYKFYCCECYGLQ